MNSKKVHSKQMSFSSTNRIEWIEKLLQNPLADHRKYSIRKILVPYLLNIRELSVEESSNILVIWLESCSQLRPLDFNPTMEIKIRVRYVENYKPLGLSKMKDENIELYRILES